MINGDESKRLRQISDTIHDLARQVDEIVAMNSPPPTTEEIDMVRAGKFLDAVKAYRNRNGTSLMISKMMMDSIAKGA